MRSVIGILLFSTLLGERILKSQQLLGGVWGRNLSASRNNVPGEKGSQRLTQADWTVQFFPGLYYSSVKYCFLSMIANSPWMLMEVVSSYGPVSDSFLCWFCQALDSLSFGLFCFYYFNFFLMCMCVLPLYLHAYHMCAWCPRRPKEVVRWFSLELESWKWNPGPLVEQQVLLTTLLLTR